ncbi:hypothetical protein [Gordonia amicalis]|uniref:hypothetical protein n=1 Tax=Gordonia amicalis TaxID=89053 RepID=UPI003A810844
MGLEDELSGRDQARGAESAERNAELTLFKQRLAEFNALMSKNGCEPEAIYEIEFLRQIQKGRPSGALLGPKPGIDEYRARAVADVWIFKIDDKDWAGPSTGTAISTDGQVMRWTTDHNSKRSTTGGLGGGGKSIKNVYLGLRDHQGPHLKVPIVALGPPTALTRAPSYGGGDGLVELAEFYLGKTTQRPNIYVP